MQRRAFITGLAGLIAARALPAVAQGGRKVPLVGVLWHAGSPEEEGPYYTALIDGFRNLGYVDGKTITLVHRFPNEIPDRFRSMAAELVAMKPDVLVSVGSSASPYTASATTSIPIVFTIVADPVAMRLVDSLARPGRNATGLSNYSRELSGKRLEVLKRTVPDLKQVGFLVNPDDRLGPQYLAEAKAAADEAGVDLKTFAVRTRDEFDRSFAAMAEDGMQAAWIASGGLMYQNRADIAKAALAHRLPVCGWTRELAEAGVLASYGTDQRTVVGRAAIYVDKILKGARPADLPVEQPTKFEMVINLKTAKAMGLAIPQSLVLLADDVIE